MKPGYRHPSPRGAGFTLIELLTVIAIIALLAGIIFPVFAAVRENARRASCMSNMRQIQTAVKQYQLDNRSYPDFLFGPAVDAEGDPVTSGQTALRVEQVTGFLNSTDTSNAAASKIKRLYSTGLFPEYVRSVDVFQCPNNDVKATSSNATAEVDRLEYSRENAQAGITRRVFYRYDSYDANPRIENVNNTFRLVPNTFEARYSKVWTPIYQTPRQVPEPIQPVYRYQLHWTTPPDDTYLTMCSHHVSKDKIVVIWLNGQAKVLDVRKLNDVRNAGGASDFDLYRLGPGGPIRDPNDA